ncbi:DUF4383 domain-containing protein [Actinosynnema sp. CA-248983]
MLIGVALVAAAAVNPQVSKRANTVVGAVYLLVGVLGLFIGGSSLDLLALNAADHGLHFASAMLLLGVGLAADRTPRRAHATR